MCLLKHLVVLSCLLCITACSTVKPLVYQATSRLDTLSSGVSFSLHTPEQSLSGSGFLVYSRPDRLHLVVLSPFGSTLMELFIKADKLACVYPAQAVGFVGSFDELPASGGLQGVHLVRWLMDFSHQAPEGMTDGKIEGLTTLGKHETKRFENGLIVSHETEAGVIYFGKYTVVNGVPFPGEIDIRDSKDNRLLIRFDEPEVNMPVSDEALLPRLDKLTLYPLSALQRLM